jgi:hypothetical protein
MRDPGAAPLAGDVDSSQHIGINRRLPAIREIQPVPRFPMEAARPNRAVSAFALMVYFLDFIVAQRQL